MKPGRPPCPSEGFEEEIKQLLGIELNLSVVHPIVQAVYGLVILARLYILKN